MTTNHPLTVEETYHDLTRLFESALATNPEPVYETRLTLAGRQVGIRIVGSEFARATTQAFEHLMETGPEVAAPSLSIDLWDQRAAGVFVDGPQRGEWTNPNPSSPDGRYSLHFHRQSTLGFDRRDRKIVGCCSAAADLSLYERGRPLHAALTQWHNDRGVPVIHAGMVAKAGRGVILTGRGGSGKSTIAVQCLLRGFGFLGDDMIGLESLPDGSFKGHSIYNSTYLERAHIARFPSLEPLAIKSRYRVEDKRLILLASLVRQGMPASAGIRAVALPRLVSTSHSTFEPTSRAAVLKALAPSSRAVNKTMGVGGFEKTVALIERTPCYTLEVGKDLEGIPGTVEKLLADADRNTPSGKLRE